MIDANQVSYRQAWLSSWLGLVEPLCTPAWYKTISTGVPMSEAADHDSADLNYWAQLQKAKESVLVEVASASVVQEAGVTPTSEVVRVAWNKVTETFNNPSPSPTYGGLTDVFMTKSGGAWLVSQVRSGASEG